MSAYIKSYLKEGKITVANGSQYDIRVSTHCDKTKRNFLERRLMCSAVGVDVDTENDISSTSVCIAPGKKADIPTPPGIVKAKMEVTIYSEPYADRNVPGERKLLCKNYAMKRGDSIVISSEDKVLSVKKGEVWIDMDGTDHKPEDKPETLLKSVFYNAGFDDVYIMIDSNEKYKKFVTDKFEESIINGNLCDFKDFAHVLPGQLQEFTFKVTDPENSEAYISAFEQKEHGHDHPKHFNVIRSAIPAGRNVILSYGGKLHLAKAGEVYVDEHDNDLCQRPDTTHFHTKGFTNISNGCGHVLYTYVHSDPSIVIEKSKEFKDTTEENGSITLENTPFKEVSPGKCEKFSRKETGCGPSMYISIFYRNPKSRGERLIEICRGYRVNSKKSVIIGCSYQILEAKKGRMWEDNKDVNHFPLFSLQRM